jgi:tRNA threonylcarbamoyladenosine biosynthesis protein TsaE
MTITTTSEAATSEAGRVLAASLGAGDVVLLDGPLGAGKTAFVRGMAEGLEASPDEVSSPTFTIVQVYAGRVPLHHVDLYRLSPVEVEELALDELGEGAVLAVEWPDRWLDPPAGAVRVGLAIVEAGRRLTIARASSPGA